MKKYKIINRKKVRDAVSAWQDCAKSDTDASGWYTGLPNDGDIVPEQDSDDL